MEMGKEVLEDRQRNEIGQARVFRRRENRDVSCGAG